MPQTPKYSLLVPSYNRPDMIRETVASLVAAARSDTEIIVADDASPRQAEIRAVLADLIDSSRIRFIGHTQNLRWSGNRNSLVQAARGDWLILLGDDDRLKAGALERLDRWIEGNPDISLFGMGYDVIDDEGRRVFTYCSPRATRYQVGRGSAWQEIFAYDAVPMWSHHPFTMCGRRSLHLTFPYNQQADIGDDVLFLYETLDAGHAFLVIPEVLFEWRNSFQVRNGYVNLSSDQARCAAARGEILLVLLARKNSLRPEVAALLESPKFLGRWLMIGNSELARLMRVLQETPANRGAVLDLLKGWAQSRFEPKTSKISRHLRAARILGLGHFANLVRFKSDKRDLTRRLGVVR
jgi:hypothetical protein